MKFWTSGRIDSGIDDEAFRTALNNVESDINNLISKQDYGELIESYDVVVNIFQDTSREKFWYNGKERQTDIDINIDHAEFLNGNSEKQYNLYLTAVLNSIEKMKVNKKLKDFNFTLFSKTVGSLIKV